MARPLPPLPTEISLLRICTQGLVSATSSASVTDAVARLLAVQGQQVSALPHALIARVPGSVGSDVTEGFQQGRLVRHRPMRGTVHITTAADFHWMRVALKTHWSSWEKRTYPAFKIDDVTTEQACDAAWQAIAANGGYLPRKQLFQVWLDNLDHTHLSSDADRHRWCTLLMYRTAHIGAVIEGPAGKNAHHFIDARTLPAADSPESGFVLREGAREGGQVEVARRYAHGHGPVTVDDLAWWAGLTKTAAARLLEAAVEADPLLGRYRLEDDGALRPANATGRPRSALLYMSRDLPDILADHRKEAARLLFLPAFDELYVGYANRTCLTDTSGDHLICPSRNGTFRPLLVEKGRLVGVRPPSQGLQWLKPPGKTRTRAAEKLVNRTFSQLRA